MDNAYEEKIRQRAYEIWETAGMRRNAEADWFEAERAIRNETAMPLAKSTSVELAAKTLRRGTMADMASGEPVAPKAAKTKAGGAKTKAPTASAIQPTPARRRAKAQSVTIQA